MKLHNTLYLPVVLLFSWIVTVTGRSLQPLQRPGALRATGGALEEQSPGKIGAALADSVKGSPGQSVREAREKSIITKDKKKKGAGKSDSQKDPLMAPPENAIAPEGDDPAKQLEKQTMKDAEKMANDATVPPKERVKVEKAIEKQAKTAAELTGVKPNQHGDISTMSIVWTINGSIVLIMVLIFSGLRKKFPLIYSMNVLAKTAPITPADTFFGWITASWQVTPQMVAGTSGLDGAMFIEFCNLNCRILALIGIPMVCIIAPMHVFFGGGTYPISAIRCLSMANVIEHHPWMYYVHAIVVNLVTFAIVQCIYGTMHKFLKLRYGWLKVLPAPRSVTVLVEGIPAQYRSDKKLREFFGALFSPDHIKEAVMVKKCPEFEALWNKQNELRNQLDEAEDHWEKKGFTAENRPMMSESMCGGKEVDTIKFCMESLAELDPKVVEARRAAEEAADTVGGVNTSTGFVTFKQKRQTAQIKNLILSPHRTEWVVTSPPPPSDILWADLKMDEHKSSTGSWIACALVFGIYFIFIPLTVLGTNLANMLHFGYFQPLWASFAPGLALMLLLGFLPTIILLIFRTFYALKADCYAQHKLQAWYFGFLMFFVILVTCIGQSLYHTFEEVIRQPERLMWLMAEHMPSATMFYMDFLMLQWVEHGSNLLRHVILAKFLLFSRVFGHDEDVAKDLAEPEDQDYYGMGSRSARFTVNMLIGIIFCSLSPVIPIFALILFCLCRIFYGYLIVFAETKKPDLGGVFFFTKLQHLFLGTGMYNVLMIGVLFCRARTKFPVMLCLPSLAYVVYHARFFSTNFVWTDLPFTEESFHTNEDEKDNTEGVSYIQPEWKGDDKLEFEMAVGSQRTINRHKTGLPIAMGDLATARFIGEDMTLDPP